MNDNALMSLTILRPKQAQAKCCSTGPATGLSCSRNGKSQLRGNLRSDSRVQHRLKAARLREEFEASTTVTTATAQRIAALPRHCARLKALPRYTIRASAPMPCVHLAACNRTVHAAARCGHPPPGRASTPCHFRCRNTGRMRPPGRSPCRSRLSVRTSAALFRLRQRRGGP
jgi:hypothetical protein